MTSSNVASQDRKAVIAEFKSVTKKYGQIRVVDNLTLEVFKGEFLAIMGPSGCGKTTTLRMLAGLEAVDEGDVLIEGKSTLKLAPHERDTPLVWQSFALFPFMTVAQNVEFGLKMRGVDRKERRRRVSDWLDRLEIAAFADRNVSALSGGQKQRVALARSLVTEPQMLLLDEPLSALDASLTLRMQSALTRLQKEVGITFVYVTHSQSEAFAMADRVVIMNKGKICQIGAPKEIYRTPASPFVADFVGSNNVFGGTVIDRSGSVLTVKTQEGIFTVLANGLATPSIGEQAMLMIAADRLEPLSADAGGEQNILTCRMISEEFVGAMVTILLETSSGKEVKLQLPQRDFENLHFQVGAQVSLTWLPENAYLLPKTVD